ncbi:hypothetical protein M426DRAFT_53985 [Hypoxylon sp. CI-4A]|nr:hypothetical protein M426DRAFT_53985 [Hypoxylon sp. CI-4A]
MASPAPTRPTILVVQGSFQLPEVYEKLANALKARGYPVIHPPLPSLIDQDSPDFASRDLSTDALAVQSVLGRLVEEESQDVLVLMHSYGGLVGSEAVLEDFSRETRKERGLPGGVIHLFFFAALILSEGQPVFDVFGESSAAEVLPSGRVRTKDPAQMLYNDLPSEEAEYWTSKTVPQSYAVQATKLTRAACRYIPSTYLVCENDQGLPPKFQEMFGKSIGNNVLRINSSHSPMLSRTEELAGIIARATEEAISKAQ